MGTVWRAADTVLRREVAVKEVVLPPGMAAADAEAMFERTLREARAAAALSHPSVVQVFDVITEDGRPWIVMELVRSRSLYEVIRDVGPVPPRRAAEIGLANHVCADDEVVADAIACAHRIAKLPRRAVEDTKRILNLHMERAVVATLDFALAAEDRSFTSPELRANLDRLLAPRTVEE